jgi:4'-phosphopantetheinyl transferase
VALGQGAGLKGSGPASRELGSRDVHIWTGGLDHDASTIRRLYALLAPDEQARAARFRFERDRGRYIAGRAQLRELLAGYLATPAQAIEFRYGNYDKPFLEGAELWFNVSHSGPVLMIAVTAIGEIGVDLELDNPEFARERIAERFFSPGEVRALRSLPEDLQGRAFLACWTRKEAFIKARGDGLQLALDSFDVSLDPGQPVALLRTAWSGSEPTEWSFDDLSDVNAGYVAAVAIRSRGQLRLSRRALPDPDGKTLNEQEE